jgi:hypothetical protein
MCQPASRSRVASDDTSADELELLRRLDRTVAIAKANLGFVERARREALDRNFEACLQTLEQQESYLLLSLMAPESLVGGLPS